MANKLNVVLGLDVSDFQKNLNVAEKKMQATAKKFIDVGSSLSLAFTAPFAILAKSAVDAFDVQAKAVAQVEAGLKSTGNQVGFTSKQLQKFASDLQSNSLFGDEEILANATAQLLTFTNIADENFKRTQQAALDLATRLDGDLKGASIQLGKALNDPVKGLSALSKSGVQFSDDQKKLIKSLVDTGQVAEAQTVILDELETQYGGSAAAAAAAGSGPITQAKMAFGDFLEVIGAIVTEALIPFAKRAKEVFERLQQINPVVLKVALGFGAVLAAVGPLLLGIGGMIKLVSTVIPIIKSLALVFNLATLKITLIVGAILAVIAGLIYLYNNFEGVRRVVNGVINIFVELFKILKEGASSVFKGIGLILKGQFLEGGKLLAEGLIKTNPVGIAITQGKRLGEAFVNGYEDETNKLQEIQAKIKGFLFTTPDAGVGDGQKGFDFTDLSNDDDDEGGGGDNDKKIKATVDVLGEYASALDLVTAKAKVFGTEASDVISQKIQETEAAINKAISAGERSGPVIDFLVAQLDSLKNQEGILAAEAAIEEYTSKLALAAATARVFGTENATALQEQIGITEDFLKSAVVNFGEGSEAVKFFVAELAKLKAATQEAFSTTEFIDNYTAGIEKLETVGRVFGQTQAEVVAAQIRLTEDALTAALEKTNEYSEAVILLQEALAKLKLEQDSLNVSVEEYTDLQKAVGNAIAQAGNLISSAIEEQGLSFKTLATSVLAGAKLIIKAFIQEGVAGYIKNVLAGPLGKTGPIALGIAAAGGAIAAGIFSSAIGRIGVPKLARGGLVTGEQLAVVGDNPSGKEAIIPFERMGEFLDMAGGGGSTRVTGLFEVRGQDLVLVLDRANQSKNRIR
jgi:hypothetical protein